MKIAENFNFRFNTFTHILKGYKVADNIKKHGALEKDKELRKEIWQQSNKRVNQLLQAKNKALQAQPMATKNEQHIPCNTLEEIH